MTHPIVPHTVQGPSGATLHLTVTARAMRLLRRLGESSLHMTIRWVPGPCSDDWCRPIPKLRVLPGNPAAPEKGESLHRNVGGIDVHVLSSVAETAARNGDRLQIDRTPFTRRFRLKGLTYALRPPTRLRS